ncbi:MAG: tetratricopeptide repeat protein [Treponema sp.]|jgi:tetratricopeptide (TPR) repeat protein|nr:tetratricopeptide repeat protein [Treponema sp.]
MKTDTRKHVFFRLSAPYPALIQAASAALLCAALALPLLNGCATATSAAEYYSIGMAYYDVGKFEEAEKWLNRARAADRTQVASEYQLGRIAFETGRFQEAAGYFESVLKRDPENLLALKAAAYTRIKTGDLELADRHYRKVLTLEPESADNGYNYALVLYAMERYADAEKVLSGHQFALLDSSDSLLLFARTQKAQGKVEAMDNYAKWLANNTDPQVRYEYAQMLEAEELYARSLEEYRSVLNELSSSVSGTLKRTDLRFAIGRLLLIADSESSEGISELQGAVAEGYSDFEAMEKLLEDERISAANKTSLSIVINDARKALEEAEEPEEEEEEAAEAAAETGEE